VLPKCLLPCAAPQWFKVFLFFASPCVLRLAISLAVCDTLSLYSEAAERTHPWSQTVPFQPCSVSLFQSWNNGTTWTSSHTASDKNKLRKQTQRKLSIPLSPTQGALCVPCHICGLHGTALQRCQSAGCMLFIRLQKAVISCT